MEKEIRNNSNRRGFKLLCRGLIALSLVLIALAFILRLSKGKYEYISASEKNAYITNIDKKTESPSVYVCYDYEPDRYIIGLLPADEYSPDMQEGDWLSIYYNIDSLKTISLNNPYKKSNYIFMAAVIIFLIDCFILILNRKK